MESFLLLSEHECDEKEKIPCTLLDHVQEACIGGVWEVGTGLGCWWGVYYGVTLTEEWSPFEDGPGTNIKFMYCTVANAWSNSSLFVAPKLKYPPRYQTRQVFSINSPYNYFMDCKYKWYAGNIQISAYPGQT